MSNNINSILSREMISVQQNDYIMKSLNELYQELIDINMNTNLTKSIKYFTNRKTVAVINKIDNALTNRFGIKIKHISTEKTAYASISEPPPNANILNENVLNVFNDLDTYFKYVKNEDMGNPDNVKDYDTELESVYYNYYKSVKAAKESMSKTGITVDLKNAKIMGLNKDYTVFLLASFYLLINEIKLTAKELTAIVLHEIGHVYSNIEYSYRSLSSTTVLIDTLNENINKKNKSVKEGIIIAYKDVLKGDSKKVDGRRFDVVVVEFMDRINKIHSNPHSVTDGEQLADQFSGRFGVGIELSTGLNKIYEYYGSAPVRIMAMVNNLGTLALYSFLFTILIAPSLTVLLPLTISILLLNIMFNRLILYVISIVTLGNTLHGTTYDENKRRAERIRNELVRQIRTTKLDKKILSSYLSQVKILDKLISISSDGSEHLNIVDKIMRKYNKKARDIIDLNEMERILEDLSENDLYLISAKIKNNIKG